MNKQEYEAKFMKNNRLSGRGMDTTCHMPCPFCAEPDFMVYKVLETEDAIQKGGVCKHCGRGIRGVVTKEANGVSWRLVQTVGDDPPEYVVGIPRDTQ